MARAALVLLVCVCALAMTARGGAAAGTAPEAAEACPPVLVAGVPVRRADAPGGGDFAERFSDISGARREEAVAAALTNGNLPAFLRDLRPVVLGGGQRGPAVVLCVTPDYLAIGSDADFLRVPMGMATALSVASHFGFVLPTRRIVDAIYAQADAKLVPEPMPPGAEMVTTGYFRRHNHGIEAQRRKRGARPGALTAGHKKDLVLTPALWRRPGRVAIYGWHRPDGRAIQPLSTVHGAAYADYSHGVRLVSEVVTVDGEARSIYDVLADPALAPLLSDEGPLPRLGELIAALGGAPAREAAARRHAVRAGAAQVRVAGR